MKTRWPGAEVIAVDRVRKSKYSTHLEQLETITLDPFSR